MLVREADAQVFRDCPTCPEMVVVPPGSFEMGVTPDEEEREGVPDSVRDRGVPLRKVSIAHPFALGRYEVTRKQFAAFVQATGHEMASYCRVLVRDGQFYEAIDLDWRNPGFAQTENDPVVCVTRADAQAYADWLGRTTGLGYRLPSEAEWEYAARAGTRTARYWGDARGDACTYGNMPDLTLPDQFKRERRADLLFSCRDNFAYTAPVGQFRPNAFGMHDMLGNVWELTADCWNPTYDRAPTDGRTWDTSGDCSFGVARGGSWSSFPWGVRAGFRNAGRVSIRHSHVGFRVVRTNSTVSLLPFGRRDQPAKVYGFGLRSGKVRGLTATELLSR